MRPSRNIFHEALFKWHVQGIRSIPNPGQPPYYQDCFFTSIKQVVDEGLLNIKTMSTGVWYRVLLENLVTHVVDDSGARQLRPCRAEVSNPDRDWEKIWLVVSTPGLPSELLSFAWLMTHNILPTRSRLFRMKMPGVDSPNCELCHDQEPDTLLHSLLLCPLVNPASKFLMSSLKSIASDLTPEKVVILDFKEDDCLPLVFLTTSILSQVWNFRREKKEINIHSIRANLEASIQILRKSRFQHHANKLLTAISL